MPALDIQGKALGVPVYALFGGPFRNPRPGYWTALRQASACVIPRFYEVRAWLMRRCARSTFHPALSRAVEQGLSRRVKPTPVFFQDGKASMFNGGFRDRAGLSDRSTRRQADPAPSRTSFSAMSRRPGPDAGLMLTARSDQRNTESYLPRWLAASKSHGPLLAQLDMRDPEGLALNPAIVPRPRSPAGIASWARRIPSLYAGPQLHTLIVDTLWNGGWQSVLLHARRNLRDPCRPRHKSVGDLGNLMKARIYLPRRSPISHHGTARRQRPDAHFLTIHRRSKTRLVLPNRPGWGSDINEDARSPPIRHAAGIRRDLRMRSRLLARK